jgi:hypothetical protein
MRVESEEMSEHAGRPQKLNTDQELSSLAVTAMAALYEAQFFDEMTLLRKRVLARGATLFDQVPTEAGTLRLVYKPMVELLLLHVRETAVAPKPAEDRRLEILWALEAAGF